jgi:lysophospholipase L1-like esterase
MITNPQAIRILCYGDSNTWGQIPGEKESRFSSDVRWTGVLQKRLGDSFEVIEEGLSSRTTHLEYAEKEGRNGISYLVPCLDTHNPLDVVILFLGTNDLKEVFHQSPQAIAQSIGSLIDIIRQYAWNNEKTTPAILVVSPTIVDETISSTQEKYRGAQEKSLGLAAEYAKIARSMNCEFADLATVIKPSAQDGLHLDKEAHAAVAEFFEGIVKQLFQGF